MLKLICSFSRKKTHNGSVFRRSEDIARSRGWGFILFIKRIASNCIINNFIQKFSEPPYLFFIPEMINFYSSANMIYEQQ